MARAKVQRKAKEVVRSWTLSFQGSRSWQFKGFLSLRPSEILTLRKMQYLKLFGLVSPLGICESCGVSPRAAEPFEGGPLATTPGRGQWEGPGLRPCLIQGPKAPGSRDLG